MMGSSIQQQQGAQTMRAGQGQGQQQQQRSTTTSGGRKRVLVITSTSHLGKALVCELAQGKMAEHFDVVAGVPVQEHKERRDILKSLASEKGAGRAIQCVDLDLEDKSKLAHELRARELDHILLVGRSEPRNAQHLCSIIDAAATLERPPAIVLMSVAQADLKNNKWAVEFAQVEEHLKASEVSDWIIIRSLFHMENLLWFADSVKKDGVLALPFEKTLAPISTSDVTRAVACVIKDCEPHKRKILTLTGPEAVSGQKMAEVLSKVLGHNIPFKRMSMAECKEVLKAKGLSNTTIEPFISFCESVESGERYLTSNAFQVIAKDSGTSIEAFLQDNREFFEASQGAGAGVSGKREL